MVKKVLITGASGLLGRAFYKEFSGDTAWTTLGLAWSRTRDHLKKVDLRDKDAVNAVIDDFKPDIIIHSAAERHPDVIEHHEAEAKAINNDATQYICDAAETKKIPVLFLSTGYVFDGKNPPFTAESETNPLNKYGVSKRDGEIITLRTSTRNIVLRIPILYGEVEFLQESPVTILFEGVKNTTKDISVSDYEIRYPTSCADVAFLVKQLADKCLKDNSISGIYQWRGNESMTKYKMAVIMAEVFGLTTGHIKPVSEPTPGAVRPHNVQMDCSKLEKLGFGRQTVFKQGIEPILKPYL